MPRIEDYEVLAPFTLEELVDAANSLLRDRPALRIQVRTVRYYISKGLLPSPSGAPKFARYGMEHLRRILEIRQGLDQGLRLDEMEPEERRRERAPAPAQAPLPKAAAPMRTRESGAPYKRKATSVEGFRRYRLTPNSSWEVAERVDPLVEIEHAIDALRNLREDLQNTS